MYNASKSEWVYNKFQWNYIYVFSITDNEFLEKDNKIWNKVSNSFKNEFDSELVYHENYLKSKIKSYKIKYTQIFIMIEYQKKGTHGICLSVLLIDPVLKIGKNYYPQVFLEKCRQTVKEKKMTRYRKNRPKQFF